MAMKSGHLPGRETMISVKQATSPARRRGIMFAVLAIIGLLIAGSQISSAHAATARTAHPAAATDTSGPKPTIVLVHGAWADSGSWNAVTALLQAAGYTVYAPPNPLQGLTYDTATIRHFLHTITGPVVLVGHSYGGEVITSAASGDSQVKALVYDDAYLPARGEDLHDLTTSGSCFYVSDLSSVFNFVPFPGAPTGVADAYVKPSVFPGCFANGLPAREGAVLAATQRPLASSTFTDQSGAPAWKTIPSWDVIGLSDRIVTPAEQLFMANRAGAHITEINAPHLSMISNPEVVASVIIQAAQATS
jgi:pimeloyl-ACP methyl ester carboxylesterase